MTRQIVPVIVSKWPRLLTSLNKGHSGANNQPATRLALYAPSHANHL